MDAFLNMAVITKNLEILRKLLYQLIREHKTTFESSLKSSLHIIISQQINVQNKVQFLSTIGDFMKEFLNRNLDLSIDDNIRWAIAQKIIIRILETCHQEKLVDVFV